jgi:hypothetical protein
MLNVKTVQRAFVGKILHILFTVGHCCWLLFSSCVLVLSNTEVVVGGVVRLGGGGRNGAPFIDSDHLIRTSFPSHILMGKGRCSKHFA